MNNKYHKKYYLRFIRVLGFTVLSIGTLISGTANSMAITADMSPEIASEYDKLLSLQNWPDLHKKLSFMDNPYKLVFNAMKKQLKAEAEPGQRKRPMTPEESLLAAKKKRFDFCQGTLPFFVDFAKRSHDLTTLETPRSKTELMSGNGIAYPFTEAETNNGNTRPGQLALTLGWKYKGKGEEHAEEFLATCLALPVTLYQK